VSESENNKKGKVSETSVDLTRSVGRRVFTRCGVGLSIFDFFLVGLMPDV
jgi:hypothetical protein